MNMTKSLIFTAITLTSTMSLAESFGNNDSYQDQNWNQVYTETVSKLKEDRKSQSDNFIYNVNQRINKIEKSKRTSFTINAPRVVDMYVRESYTVLERDYIVKNAPIWKKVLIKQKEVWDY